MSDENTEEQKQPRGGVPENVIDPEDPDIAALSGALAQLGETEDLLVDKVKERAGKLRQALGPHLDGLQLKNATLRAVLLHGGTGSSGSRKSKSSVDWGEEDLRSEPTGSGYSRLKLVPVTCYVKGGMNKVLSYTTGMFTWNGELVEDPRDTFDGPNEQWIGWEMDNYGENPLLDQVSLPVTLERAKELKLQRVDIPRREGSLRKQKITGKTREYNPRPEVADEFVRGTENLIADMVDAINKEQSKFSEGIDLRNKAQLPTGSPSAAKQKQIGE